MKYKADFSKQYKFNDVMSCSYCIWYATHSDGMTGSSVVNDSCIIIFSSDKKNMSCNGQELNYRLRTLNQLNWYKAYEITENPSFYTKEDPKYSGKSTTTHVDQNFVINGINVKEFIKEVCKEEIRIATKNSENKGIFKEYQWGYQEEKKGFSKGGLIQSFTDKIKEKEKKDNIKFAEKINSHAKEIKTSKKKKSFDGEENIWISTCGKFMKKSKYEPHSNISFRLATQSEINQFFHGAKKRKENNRITYVRSDNNFIKITHLKYGVKSEEITESEYLEGIKK